MKKKTVNLKVISAVLIIIGIVYIIAGIVISALWEYIQSEEWGIVMAVEGVIFAWTGFGLMIKQLLPQKKLWICLLIGYLTAFIGIIVALIVRKSSKKAYKGDKYENLEKLQQLKEQGVITEEEFKIEKEKY